MVTFGKYQVIEFIGQGGFGRVFRAYDPSLKRQVAIKTCTLQDPDMRQRFAREAEIAANLRHPNIVTVYDFSVQDAEPYIVQEYLDGEDIDHKVKRGDTFDLGTLIGWLRAVAEGLLFAHARGVVHRDIKPGNIRILPDGQVRIMDFGIAKLLQTEQQLTQTGMSVGTTGYLAPEQLRGIEIDHRVDIFSFGVMAYQLVASRKPFDGDTITTVLYRIAHEDPPPLREVAPQCPPALAALIERCLRKERNERYPSFAPIIEELDTVTRELHGGAEAKTADAFNKTDSEPRPRRLSPAAWGLIAATVAVALFGVLNISRFGSTSTPDQQPIPIEPAMGADDPIESAASDDPTTPAAGDELKSSGPPAPAPSPAPTNARTAGPDRAPVSAPPVKPALNARRVVLLVRSDLRVGIEAAEQTLTSELMQAGYQVVDADLSSNDVAGIGRSRNAATVVLLDVSADARPIVAGMFSGSAAVGVKTYDAAGGRILSAERFEIGTAQTPGQTGPTETAAASAAVRAASYRAAQFVLSTLRSE